MILSKLGLQVTYREMSYPYSWVLFISIPLGDARGSVKIVMRILKVPAKSLALILMTNFTDPRQYSRDTYSLDEFERLIEWSEIWGDE